MKIKILLFGLLTVGMSLFFSCSVQAYQKQPNYNVSKYFSSASTKGISWANTSNLSSSKVNKITLYLGSGDAGVNWKLYCRSKDLLYSKLSDAVVVTNPNFYTFNFQDNFAENNIAYCILACYGGSKNCGYGDYAWYLSIYGSSFDADPNTVPYGGGYEPVIDLYYEVLTEADAVIPFKISSPKNNDPVVDDSWVTVTGTCPIVGEKRIGFTDDCLGFQNIKYETSCVNNKFEAKVYHSSLSDRIIARDKDSVSGDCVDYDDLMDFVTVSGFEVIQGYPNDWYFNFDYYDDYNIKIKSPSFDTALTLPIGSTESLFTFGFVYPPSSSPSNLNFTIKQYDSNGTLLNGNYHSKNLGQMSDTWNYPVTMMASSTKPLHYVVQLTENGVMKRQFPFAIYVSDIDFTYSGEGNTYFFPHLVDLLKTKVIFNYYFAFHDGFYKLFNGNVSSTTDQALDITFKSVSGNKQYNTEIKIFSASDPLVKNFASSLRPYITAFLWLIFALYLILRISYLFSGNNQD